MQTRTKLFAEPTTITWVPIEEWDILDCLGDEIWYKEAASQEEAKQLLLQVEEHGLFSLDELYPGIFDGLDLPHEEEPLCPI